MKSVYLLHHVCNEDEEDENVILIGVYSSERRALLTKERLKDKPGFRNFPEGFHLEEYEIDLDHWVEGFGVP